MLLRQLHFLDLPILINMKVVEYVLHLVHFMYFVIIFVVDQKEFVQKYIAIKLVVK